MARRKLSRRESTLLVVLSLVAVAFLGRFVLRPAGGAQGGPGAGLGTAPTGDAPAVRIALLSRAPDPYDPDGRDLFKYAQRPETLAERLARERAEAERLRRLREEAERRRLAEEAAAKARAEQEELAKSSPPRPAAPQPPRAPFKYLGYLGPKENRIAVFENGEELLLARTGDTIAELFQVREIAYQKVVLGFTADEFKSQTTELAMKKVK